MRERRTNLPHQSSSSFADTDHRCRRAAPGRAVGVYGFLLLRLLAGSHGFWYLQRQRDALAAACLRD